MFCFLFCVFCIFVLFVYCFSACKYLFSSCVQFYHCHRLETQFHLTNIISYHIKYMSSTRSVCNLELVVLACPYIIIFILIFSVATSDFVIILFSFLRRCYFIFVYNME